MYINGVHGDYFNADMKYGISNRLCTDHTTKYVYLSQFFVSTIAVERMNRSLPHFAYLCLCECHERFWKSAISDIPWGIYCVHGN